MVQAVKLRMGKAGAYALPPISPDILGFGPADEFEEPRSPAVPVSTVAPFHNSIGDISTAIVTQQYLSTHGIPSYSTSFWDTRHPTIVIGGGEIIGFPKVSAWRHVRAHFLPEGRHALNAVGFDLKTDPAPLSLIANYKYVSVRDHDIAAVFRRYCDDVAVVPCPATLQQGIPLALAQSIPRYEILNGLEPGGYIVIHRHPTLVQLAAKLRRQGHKLVVVDMQAHAQHPWKARDIVIPAIHSPEVVKGLVDSASAVLTASLHLAIFAISAGKPFAAVENGTSQSDKVRRYLERAGINDVMGGVDSDLLELAMRAKDRVIEVSASERAATQQHLRAMTEAVRLS
jgi:hypothetical protein